MHVRMRSSIIEFFGHQRGLTAKRQQGPRFILRDRVKARLHLVLRAGYITVLALSLWSLPELSGARPYEPTKHLLTPDLLTTWNRRLPVIAV